MKGYPTISMRDALANPRYFGGIVGADSWRNWRTILTAAFPDKSSPLTKDELKVYTHFTGRTKQPSKSPRRIAFRASRRAGKDASSAIAISWLLGPGG
jgi:hypothetical protein